MQSQSQAYDVGLNRFFSRVYLKVALGVGVSALMSLIFIKFMPTVPLMIYSNPILTLTLVLLEFLVVFMCSRRAYNGNPTSTMIWYVVYSIMTALTLTVAFYYVGNPKIIVEAFAVTAVTFVGMSAYGHLTKRDLSTWRNLLVGVLIGVFVALLFNLFLHSGALAFFCNIVSVVLFAAYMSYDTQMIRRLYAGITSEEQEAGIATYSAMMLYMDLINMFINLLYLFSDIDRD